MINLKKESGITLIALIITIIILVILAAVSIRAVTNMKIVDMAVNGSQNYVKAGKTEEKTMDDTVSFIDEAVAKVEAASNGKKSVTNPYKNENWEIAWTCTNGTWSIDITDNTQTLTGDISAKLYKKGENYHLVIEKIGESGEMGKLYTVANLKNNTLLASNSETIRLAARPSIPCAWQQADDTIVEKITKVIICDGVTSIGNSAFRGLSNLTTVEISSSVTSIGGIAFGSCINLKSITIPEGVISIDYSAFEVCGKLETIEIPSTVTEIGSGCFNTDANMTTVYIKKNANEISGEPWIGSGAYTIGDGLSEEEGHYNLKIKYIDEEHSYNYCSNY